MPKVKDLDNPNPIYNICPLSQVKDLDKSLTGFRRCPAHEFRLVQAGSGS
jgi:hypothetical protein